MIAKLWVFADAHVVPLLQNVASDGILEKIKDTRTFPSLDDLTYIYDNTMDSSPLRRHEVLQATFIGVALQIPRPRRGHELQEPLGSL